MKKFICFLICIAAVGCVKAQDVTTAKWFSQPVVIDGNANEWGELNLYDDDTKLSFAIANDSNNIYLCFENSDQANQMKMMRAGMKVSLSTKGKNKHDATIEFPLPQSKQSPQTQTGKELPENADSNDAMPSQHIHNASSFRSNYVSNHSMMNVSGFATVNGEVSVSNTPGIKATINWDSASNLFYEIAIAKKEFYGADYSPSNTSGDITLNVEINALRGADAENRTASSGENGNHHWQGGGGMHGGRQFNNNGNNSNQNQNYQSQRAALNVKSSFKQKFALSTAKTEG